MRVRSQNPNIFSFPFSYPVVMLSEGGASRTRSTAAVEASLFRRRHLWSRKAFPPRTFCTMLPEFPIPPPAPPQNVKNCIPCARHNFLPPARYLFLWFGFKAKEFTCANLKLKVNPASRFVLPGG